ncbi:MULTISPECIES: cell wall metabolism sensor histidine kinase WalK [Trichocoleus]|uniref:histidine kinase n=1 Tax=Trichocoleus desertorum GB2-A4 TaxID=2933944 RepID=A0ABV0J5R4_9CYAN|nr:MULTISPECIES: ATP-binding protein [unclassified Trichocoleus]MBD1863960.1 HAMP domain-containing protein [Trichocoleus sp. FACHB-46]MBD2095503.1 HAMP domain-containing protein [Trichocoleus sp. FACHB-591]
MNLIGDLLTKITQNKGRIDPFSLQFRLTVGIIGASVLSFGGVAIWTTWTTYQILIDSHKQNIIYLTDRLPRDVELYSEMIPVDIGLRRAINNVTSPNLLIWARAPDGSVLAQAETLKTERASQIVAAVDSLPWLPTKPQSSWINGSYLLLSSEPLAINGTRIGKLYIAQDITRDQARFLGLIRSLSLVNLLAILALAMAIASYIRRSLQPLREMSQMTQVISVDDLGQAQLQLDSAPSEVTDLAQTFNTMLSRLSDSWTQQREFVSNVSHELRTPLTIVHGYLQSMQRRSQNLTEAQQEALDIAAVETERIIRLLQDLLDLARADSGYLHLSWEPIDLAALLREVASMADPFSSHTIQVEIERLDAHGSGAESIHVKADRSRLRQVLINLIDNAVKYSEPHTPVTLRLHQFDEFVALQVSDRGCGIDLPHQTRIFERFYRVDEARSRSTGGSGLGLSIVKTLVEGMGGSITVRSKLGEGSVFTVTLPNPSVKL